MLYLPSRFWEFTYNFYGDFNFPDLDRDDDVKFLHPDIHIPVYTQEQPLAARPIKLHIQ